MKYFGHLRGVKNRYRLIKSILIMKLILIFLAILGISYTYYYKLYSPNN